MNFIKTSDVTGLNPIMIPDVMLPKFKLPFSHSKNRVAQQAPTKSFRLLKILTPPKILPKSELTNSKTPPKLIISYSRDTRIDFSAALNELRERGYKIEEEDPNFKLQ